MNDVIDKAILYGWSGARGWVADLVDSVDELRTATSGQSLVEARVAALDVREQVNEILTYLTAIKAVEDVQAQDALQLKLKAAGHE